MIVKSKKAAQVLADHLRRYKFCEFKINNDRSYRISTMRYQGVSFDCCNVDVYDSCGYYIDHRHYCFRDGVDRSVDIAQNYIEESADKLVYITEYE